MRVGIDLRPALRRSCRHRGLGRFTRELARRLIDQDRVNQYLLYSDSHSKEGIQGLTDRVPVRRLPEIRKPARLNWLLDRRNLPRALRRDGIDLFHATDFTSIPRAGNSGRVWAYVHDLIPFLFWRESRFTIDYRWALKSAIRRAQRAERIITVSHHSRQDICRGWGVMAEKVHVLYQGCDPRLTHREAAVSREGLRRRYGLSERFVFYVGGSDYRKNLPRWIRAFARIRSRGYGGKMVLAGETFRSDIEEVRRIKHEVSRQSLEEQVIYPGYVPDDDLADFYSACDLFVFPSLYEGFGIPLVEAMTCRAPILSSNAASLPEVAGPAAVYFDPTDEASMVEAFFEVLEDEEKQRSLVSEGVDRVGLFDWGRAASQLVELMNGPPPSGAMGSGQPREDA